MDYGHSLLELKPEKSVTIQWRLQTEY